MFIIFGTKNVEKKVINGIKKTGICSKCRSSQGLCEYSSCSYFSLFFIPIFPTGKESHYLKCEACNTDYYLDYSESNESIDMGKIALEENKGTKINCPSCGKNIYIENFENEHEIECSSCKHKFTVRKRYSK